MTELQIAFDAVFAAEVAMRNAAPGNTHSRIYAAFEAAASDDLGRPWDQASLALALPLDAVRGTAWIYGTRLLLGELLL